MKIDRRRARRGQALVEFALLVPVFALIVLGALDFGRVFYTYEAIANAAREGARYCALNAYTDPGGTLTRVVDELNGSGITLDKLDKPLPTCDANVPPGQPVTVTVRTTFTPITPLITDLIGGPIHLHVSATMMMWDQGGP